MKEKGYLNGKKLALTLVVFLLHLYLGITSFMLMMLFVTDYGSNIVLNAEHFSVTLNKPALIFNGIVVVILSMINLVVIKVFVNILNNSLSSVNHNIMEYASNMMLIFTAGGTSLLLLINYSKFPLSLVPITVTFIPFSASLYFTIMRKIKRIMKSESEKSLAEPEIEPLS